MLSGFASAKAVQRTLMKLSPVCVFHVQIGMAAYALLKKDEYFFE